ncbi:wax ester/triacylglycerol synthase family O-acyltransferase [Desulfobacterales bacterium HSG16]|nr:wax ester/triacylglycerol synthase family O-acyltransferase [Desulfobacterales bacterium HSG16]
MSNKLGPLDLAFLAIEQPKNPMAVGLLQIYEIPENYEGNYTRDLYNKFMQIEAGPPFNRRLSHTMAIQRPHWKVDENFDLEYHVRHAALPEPGSTQDLFDLVMRIHTRMLDRQRPLWEFYVIEGLEGNRFALYSKLHHATIDGMRGMTLVRDCLNEDPKAPLKVFWEPMDYEAKQEYQRTSITRKIRKLKKKLQFQTALAKDLTHIITTQQLKLFGLKPSNSPVPFTAPNTFFNTPIKGARRLAVNSYRLQEIKTIAKESDSTINDIVLLICARALQKYLEEKKELPKKALYASIPVSVANVNRPGNYITYVAANLATDIKDLRDQFLKIKESIGYAKQEIQEVTPAAAISFAVLGQSLLAVLSKLGITNLLPPPANLIISNVPGPKNTLYLGDAKMLAQYPLSVLPEAQALNITIVSYTDSIDIALFVCRDTVPDVAKLSEYMDLSYKELKQAEINLPPLEIK